MCEKFIYSNCTAFDGREERLIGSGANLVEGNILEGALNSIDVEDGIEGCTILTSIHFV